MLVDAEIALTRGDWDRVTQDLEEAGALLEGARDWSERVQLWNLRARVELRRGRLSRARDALREARGLANRAGTPALMAALYAETLLLDVEAATRAGEAEAAREALAALASLGDDSGQPTIRAYSARGRGLYLASTGDLSGAIAALEEASSLWERVGWKYELSQSQLRLAELYRAAGSSSTADLLESTARSYLGRIRATLP
jgi:tetratricopeptide (TPR) repeat protein